MDACPMLLLERRNEPRLADARLSSEKDNASFAGFGLFPTAQQQVQLFRSSHKRQFAGAQGLKAAI